MDPHCSAVYGFGRVDRCGPAEFTVDRKRNLTFAIEHRMSWAVTRHERVTRPDTDGMDGVHGPLRIGDLSSRGQRRGL
jgi:hypothetical protein